MSSEPPSPGAIPGWGQQPEGSPPSGEPAQPAAPQPAGPSPAAPGTGAIPGWGQPQAPAPQPVPPSPAPDTGAIPGWGQPQAPAPQAPAAQPGWGQPPAPAPQAPSAQPGWGAPAAAPPPAPSTPPAPGAQPGWGGPSGAPGAPGGMPPGGWNPQPAQSSGSSGCLKLLLILIVIAVIGFTLLIVGILLIGNRIIESAGGVNSDGSVGKPCTIVDNGTLSDVLGSGAQAIELTGLYDVSIGLIADKRVLPDAYDCWITADTSTALGRIAEYQGGDAAAVFQQELQKAQPTSQDQGGGITLENSGYFAGNVQGLGDEAFCTGFDMALQAGVLVRKGDTLLYVSLTGPPDSVPSMELTSPGVIAAPGICDTAQEIARRILH